jgi:hypothetical protein
MSPKVPGSVQSVQFSCPGSGHCGFHRCHQLIFCEVVELANGEKVGGGALLHLPLCT